MAICNCKRDRHARLWHISNRTFKAARSQEFEGKPQFHYKMVFVEFSQHIIDTLLAWVRNEMSWTAETSESAFHRRDMPTISFRKYRLWPLISNKPRGVALLLGGTR